MPRAPKACAAAGCDERVVGRVYCVTHTLPNRSPSDGARAVRTERRRRAEAVSAWVAVNGWVCPGWERPEHASTDLTAAHSTAVAKGGAGSALFVLCRSCNARQGVDPF